MPPEWHNHENLFENYQRLKKSVNGIFKVSMLKIMDEAVLINMLLMWCGPDGQGITMIV